MKPVFLIISQVYVPDPAAVGQYLADAAAEMARRGYVEIRRLPLAAVGTIRDTDNRFT